MDVLGKLSEKEGGLTEGVYKVIWFVFFGCIFVVRIKKFIVKCWDIIKRLNFSIMKIKYLDYYFIYILFKV